MLCEVDSLIVLLHFFEAAVGQIGLKAPLLLIRVVALPTVPTWR